MPSNSDQFEPPNTWSHLVYCFQCYSSTFECILEAGFHFTYASPFHLVQEQQPAYPTLYPALLPISAYCKVDAASTDGANLSAVACDRG